MSKLSKRQQQILEFIRSEVANKGYPRRSGRLAKPWA